MAIIGSIISGALGFLGANKAAKAQERIGREQIGLQREIYDETSGRLQPYTGAGQNALSAYLYELGLGPQPTLGGAAPDVSQSNFDANRYLAENPDVAQRWSGTPWDHYQKYGRREGRQAYGTIEATPEMEYQGIGLSPAGQFAMTQGRDTIEAGAAAGGGLYSGSTMKGLEDYRFGLATTDRDNQLNRLAGLMGTGQNAAAMQGAAGQNFATGASNALANIGDAQAAGIVGGVNAVNSSINNYLGYQQMNKLLAPQAQQQTGGTNWFGGLW